MGKKFYLALILTGMMCLMSVSVMAVPLVINYQGELTDTSDCVLSGNYDVQFLLYDTLTGGTVLWDEIQNVSVDNGLFDVQLGAVSSFPTGLFENDNLYLEMVIYNPDEASWETLSPREKLTSTAYAIKADHAATAVSATAADHATTADNAASATNAGHADTADSATVATSAGNADTLDGKDAGEFLDVSDNTQTKAGGLNIGGNVGIGTTSPSERLEVAGAVKLGMNSGTASGTIRWTGEDFEGYDGTNWLSFTEGGSGSCLWSESGGNVYRSSGKVGIGIANPSWKLEVVGANDDTGGVAGLLIRHTDNALKPFGIDKLSNGDARIFASAGEDSSNLSFHRHGSTGGEVMRIDGTSGNVGIGTTSPSERLEVAGVIKSSSGGFIFPDGTVQATAAIGGGGAGGVDGYTKLMLHMDDAGLTDSSISGHTVTLNVNRPTQKRKLCAQYFFID